METNHVNSSTNSASGMERRGFISVVGGAWILFIGSMVTGIAAVGRFMFPNVRFEPPFQFKVGYPDEIPLGVVDTRFKDTHGIWLVRNETGIYALSTVCTHLGCTPNWLENENKFKCPCHGSGFRKDGTNFEGPAPRPLERFRIALSEDGQILVDKSKKFLRADEWTLPDALLRV